MWLRTDLEKGSNELNSVWIDFFNTSFFFALYVDSIFMYILQYDKSIGYRTWKKREFFLLEKLVQYSRYINNEFFNGMVCYVDFYCAFS